MFVLLNDTWRVLANLCGISCAFIVPPLPLPQYAHTPAAAIEDLGYGVQHVRTDSGKGTRAFDTASFQLNHASKLDTVAITKLEDVLERTDGVEQAVVNKTTDMLTVSYNSRVIGVRSLMDVVCHLGYAAVLDTADPEMYQLQQAHARQVC